MIEAWPSTDIRAAEEPLLTAGIPLMDRAAFGLAAQVAVDIRSLRGPVVGARVVLLVGAGNNGGDALYAGALLRRRGVAVTALCLASAVHPGGSSALSAAGGRLVRLVDVEAGTDVEPGVDAVKGADVVLDAICGIGARGGLRGAAVELVARLVALWSGAERRPWVVAVDVPSGIGVDDGTVPGLVLGADRTVSIGVAKPGTLLPPAGHLAGEVAVVDIGLPLRAATRAPTCPDLAGRTPGSLALAPAVRRLELADVGSSWPVPGAADHKYTRGVVGVVAGTAIYPGAAVLASEAASRAGVGMVRYLGAVPEAVLAARPEVVIAPGRVQAWVVGPGMPASDGADQHDLVRSVLRSALGKVPIVMDAGALALLPEWVPSSVVVTPHAGELASLLAARGESVDRGDVEAEPLRWARRAHELTGATVLLKGAITVVVGGGAPESVFAQADGTPWLATAGSGDVLAGLLAAMLASMVAAGWPGGPGGTAGRSGIAAGRDGAAGSQCEAAATARVAASAALIHGHAGTIAAGGGAGGGFGHPVTALDVARALPAAIGSALRAAGRTEVRHTQAGRTQARRIQAGRGGVL